MKRASLLDPKLNPAIGKAEATDLADRLLARASGDPKDRPARGTKSRAATKSASARPKRKSQKKAGGRVTSKSLPDEPLPYVPYRPVPEGESKPFTGPEPTAPEETSPKVDEALARAIEQSRSAVEALVAAADLPPARFELGIRYRIDSLAHHFRQIVEYLERARTT